MLPKVLAPERCLDPAENDGVGQRLTETDRSPGRSRTRDSWMLPLVEIEPKLRLVD